MRFPETAFFIRTGGTVKVKGTGERKRSGLPQGGMEIPCVLLLEHVEEKILNKARKLLSEKGFQEAPVEEPANKKSETEVSPNKKTCSKPKAAQRQGRRSKKA